MESSGVQKSNCFAFITDKSKDKGIKAGNMLKVRLSFKRKITTRRNGMLIVGIS
jgi:hypothetical protein